MAAFETRLETARRIVDDPRITVSDLEHRLATRYTAETLAALINHFQNTAFVWIMGADNLVQIDQWKNWTAIFTALPIAVFDRPTYFKEALASRAAKHFATSRIDGDHAFDLAGLTPPAWVFVQGKMNSASATDIRRAKAT